MSLEEMLVFIKDNLENAFGKNYPTMYLHQCDRQIVSRQLCELESNDILDEESLKIIIANQDKQIYVDFETRHVGCYNEDFADDFIVFRYYEQESDEEYFDRIKMLYDLVVLRLDPNFKLYLKLNEKFAGVINHV